MHAHTQNPEQHQRIKRLAIYHTANLGRSLVQLVETLVLFSGFWLAACLSVDYSILLTLVLTIPAGCFLMRLFVIMHDCWHGTFFASRRANEILGFILGVLLLTPFYCQRRYHLMHHATSGNLDRRVPGAIQLLTVREYLDLSPLKKIRYRLYRNPLFLFGIAPVLLFMLHYRFAYYVPRFWKRERASVYWTNAIAAISLGLVCWVIGVRAFILVHVSAGAVAGSIGIWLFYIQHQFEGVYWRRQGQWQFVDASLRGSSFYDLPRLLHWLTLNISFHHIHHLDARIPNYRLRECFDANPNLQVVKRISLWESFATTRLKLWDEGQEKLVGFPAVAKQHESQSC